MSSDMTVMELLIDHHKRIANKFNAEGNTEDDYNELIKAVESGILEFKRYYDFICAVKDIDNITEMVGVDDDVACALTFRYLRLLLNKMTYLDERATCDSIWSDYIHMKQELNSKGYNADDFIKAYKDTLDKDPNSLIIPLPVDEY